MSSDAMDDVGLTTALVGYVLGRYTNAKAPESLEDIEEAMLVNFGISLPNSDYSDVLTNMRTLITQNQPTTSGTDSFDEANILP